MRSRSLRLAAALALALPSTAAADLDGLRRRYAATEDAQARIDLLDEIAALHVSDSSDPTITAAVVDGLADDASTVRVRAAELLGAGLNVDVALDGLVVAASRMSAELEAILKSRETVELPDYRTAKKDEYLKKLDEFKTRMEEATQELTAYYDFRKALTGALLTRRDDRSVEGLRHLAVGTVTGDEAWPIVNGLLSLGSQPAVECVVEYFELAEDLLDDRAKERKKLAREKPEKQPSSWRGTKDAWKEREQRRIDSKLEDFDAKTAKYQEWVDELATRVRAFAVDNGLPAAPSNARENQWKSWWRKARPALPESVTG